MSVAFAITTTAAGCANQQPGTPARGPVEITDESRVADILVGKTFYGRYPNGSRWTEYVSRGGDTAYREGPKTCAGHWHVSGNIACFMYDSYKNGEPNCFNIWRSGDNTLFVPMGGDPTGKNIVVVDRIDDGDPQNLMSDRGACR
ncbi:MAG TPA: hypothetical protein VMT54_12780 [Candidatus Cybelea sp.]|nr:hypothetical protein [Candidatus Cybelea sp.]